MTYNTGFYVEQGGNDVVMTDDVSFTHAGQEIPTGATITVGAENTGAGTINVAIQLLAKDGTDLANRATIFAYLSADANGDAIATASSGTVVIGTDGLAIPLVAKLAFMLTSEADGDIDITITEASTLTQYLVLVLPTGRRVISDAITFA
jgi:hypothetical protein